MVRLREFLERSLGFLEREEEDEIWESVLHFSRDNFKNIKKNIYLHNSW